MLCRACTYYVFSRYTNCVLHKYIGPKKAVQMHREYTAHITAANDPEDFRNKVSAKYTWPNGGPATDYPDRFKQNVRLFRYFHVFLFTSLGNNENRSVRRQVRNVPAFTRSHPITPYHAHTHTDFRWTWDPTSHSLAVQGDIISRWGN